MSTSEALRAAVGDLDRLAHELEAHRHAGRIIVTTNGCFDLFHAGHVALLDWCAQQGDVVVVGLNSDASVRRLKGVARPVHRAVDRATVLCSLEAVDHCVVFDDDLPLDFLRFVRPDVHVKGGDYRAEALPEGPLVQSLGGRIRIFDRVDALSSTSVLEGPGGRAAGDLMRTAGVLWSMVDGAPGMVSTMADRMAQALERGGRVLACGNGGSAADAQHFVSELVGRFARERAALPAVALTCDGAVLTALANDYGYERVFARQVEGLGSPGDVLLALSTSGSSENVVQAARTARERGIVVCAITGASGHRLADEAEHALLLPSTLTADIQVATLTCLHAIANLLEERVGRVP